MVVPVVIIMMADFETLSVTTSIYYRAFILIPFTKIRVARKTSASTTHCRLNEFDAANRVFWVWY